jgi:hypothetical protein|nr:MAG TPA_asm: hypothetical protein [Caudoviricetes sp.]
MEEDWPLIEASLNKQYGIRIRKEIKDMNYAELCTLISGVMPDTPLGNIVQIRSEDDEDTLKNFTQEQKNIRWEYRNKIAKKVSKEDYEKAILEMQKAFKEMAGGSK